MGRRSVAGLVAGLVPLLVLQAAFQVAQVKDREVTMPDMWPGDDAYQMVLVAAIAAGIVLAFGVAIASGDIRSRWRRIASGFSPTAPLLTPLFTLSVLVLKYGPAQDEFTNRRILLMAVSIAVAGWFVFSVWRGAQSSPRGIAPELYESLKTEYLALSEAVFPEADADAFKAAMAEGRATGMPAASDAPLPKDRIPGYLMTIGKEIGFEKDEPPEGMRPSPRAWNSGSAYLQTQRKMAYVRDSMVAWETTQATLSGQALALEMRLTGSNLPESTRVTLTEQLREAKGKIEDGKALPVQASRLYTIAATISSFMYGRQKALLQMQTQQHWLVVMVQVIAAVILAIAVLDGARAQAIAAAILFFLVGAGSGILSLLHVRQSVESTEYVDDYGLFRIELARAFTLSGMAGLIAVFLVANLPILAGAGVFDPPPVTEEVGTPSAPSTGTSGPEGTPVATEPVAAGTPLPATAAVVIPGMSIRAYASSFLMPPGFMAQDAAGPAGNDAGDEERTEWVPLRDIFAFSNLGGILVALLAGWVPERLFRQLTVKGEQLQLDIQSVSRSGV